jgi:DmsE family decaheme c-type cytochrome
MMGLRAGLALGFLAGGALLSALVEGSSMAAQAKATSTKEAPATSTIDVQECATCHEQAVHGSQGTPHAALEGSCGSCHGDATAHLKSVLENGEPGPITSLAKMKPAKVVETCLSCHEKGHQRNWAGGVHDRRDVGCTSCHSVHAYKSLRGQLKTAREVDTCYSCHQQIRAKGLRASHHPVREGKMGCSDCHDPHDGSKPKMVKTEWITEGCLTCHTEKRGPFLWEHAPVRENCALCHDPHGSNHDKMLVAKQPFLCQRCHLNTRHPGTLYDGSNTQAGRLVGGTGIPTVSNRAVEHACKNCHQNVHGGNAPSGPYLGR